MTAVEWNYIFHRSREMVHTSVGMFDGKNDLKWLEDILPVKMEWRVKPDIKIPTNEVTDRMHDIHWLIVVYYNIISDTFYSIQFWARCSSIKGFILINTFRDDLIHSISILVFRRNKHQNYVRRRQKNHTTDTQN